MAKVVVKTKAKKVKRKFPVKFYAPSYLDSVLIGEAEVTNLSKIIGKNIVINERYVTNNVKNQNIRLTFKVIKVDSGKAETEVYEYTQISYYLNRFLKKGVSLVEDSFIIETKDGAKVRVKPFIVTKNKVSNLVKTSIRKRVQEYLKDYTKKLEYTEFIKNVIDGLIQNELREDIKKIYPLKVFEFRRVVRLNEKK